MTTDNDQTYIEIEKIVIAKIKNEAKGYASMRVNNWAGDAYLTNKQLQDSMKYRKRIKKGYKMLLEAFKLLKY